jgi:hypothetical protein
MAFLRRFLVALALLSVLYVAPLRAVNPEGDFRDGLFAPIVIDAREWKMSQVRAMPDRGAYDALVLGSSRSMQLGPEIDTRYGVHAYNFAVDSAHVEDYLAIYRWSKQVGMAPRLIALGLDLEALHDADIVDERYARNAELAGALAERGGAQRALDALRTEVSKYRRMFTTWYVRDAAQSVRVHLSAQLPPAIEALGERGVISYPRWEGQRAAGTFDLRAEIASCLPLYEERFRDMRGLSAWRAGLLEELLRETRADGVAVVVWLTPLHADTVEHLRAGTRYSALRAGADALLATLAARYGASWRDLSEPASFDATPDGWYDCAHVDARNLARLAAALPR